MHDRQLSILSVAVLLAVALLGGGLVISGLFIGLLTSVVWLVLAMKSPFIRGFARRCPFLADVLATGLSYAMFPPGVTAFIGAGVVALVVTAMISLSRLARPVPVRRTVTQRMWDAGMAAS